MDKSDASHQYPIAGGPLPESDRGVFETMLVVSGEPTELESHLARLRSSVRELYELPLPRDAAERVAAAARDLRLGRLRLTVVPEDGALASEITVAAVEASIVNPGANSSLTLTPVVTPAATGSHKWADRRRLDQLESASAPSLPLLMTDDRLVLETSRGNLFAVHSDVVTTPPLDGRILPGVTREIVLDICRAEGLAAHETEIDLERLTGADEAFATGSIRGVEPVRDCAGTSWSEGVVTSRIAAALRRRWQLSSAGLGSPEGLGL